MKNTAFLVTYDRQPPFGRQSKFEQMDKVRPCPSWAVEAAFDLIVFRINCRADAGVEMPIHRSQCLLELQT